MFDFLVNPPLLISNLANRWCFIVASVYTVTNVSRGLEFEAAVYARQLPPQAEKLNLNFNPNYLKLNI